MTRFRGLRGNLKSRPAGPAMHGPHMTGQRPGATSATPPFKRLYLAEGATGRVDTSSWPPLPGHAAPNRRLSGPGRWPFASIRNDGSLRTRPCVREICAGEGT